MPEGVYNWFCETGLPPSLAGIKILLATRLFLMVLKVSLVCLFVHLSNLSFGLGTVVPRLDEQCVQDVPDIINEDDSLLNLASVGSTEFIPRLI